MTERARVFEEAGYSLFGAMAINAHAPDEGNMHLLAESPPLTSASATFADWSAESGARRSR